METNSRIRLSTMARLFRAAVVLLSILSITPRDAAAQQTSMSQQASALKPQDPTATPDRIGPVVITEGQTVSTATGAQTQVFSTILLRPNDAEHAVDPQTGRNFNWDPDKQTWVNSQTGEAANFTGYLCPSAPLTAAAGGLKPQDPTATPDRIGPVIITEGQTVSTATGAQTQVFSTVLLRPNDAEHATDPQTGRNFNWDPDKQTWVNSQTGEAANFTGYLCPTPSFPPSATQPAKQETPPQPPPTTPPQKTKTVSMSGFTPAIQLRGFGGASFINGNTPANAGFDGAVLFPLGNRILVGPTAGFQWVDSSIIKTIGGGPPPSTFINTSVGFKSGNFGGRIAFPFGGWQLGIHGGATVASSTITQATGFCGGTSPTGGTTTGCTTTSSTTTHDTVVGPFVGGYISHSIFSHVGVFVEGDYHHLNDNKIFDLNYGEITAGLVLSFGRHK